MLNELIIPASALEVVKQYEGSSDQLGHFLKSQVWDADYLPHFAILGLPEGRGSGCLQVADAPDAIRRHLYALTTCPPEFNLVIVDDRIDNNERENSPSDEFYINNLPIGTSVSVIAGQSYFICQQEHDIVAEGYNGEILTLGEIRADFKEMEPLLRESDLVSFDFGSLKSSEAPGQYRISPNGLTGEEACQIAWYSGISTKQTWFGLFGYSPSFDSTSFGAMMSAQIGWYFINGVSKRLDEEPIDEATNFEHYHIPIDGLDDPISFLQHPVSRRWWMEVPDENCDIFPVRIPCSKKDYRKACENEIPERWWKYFSKI